MPQFYFFCIRWKVISIKLTTYHFPLNNDTLWQKKRYW
jgi:hypothetical protein